MVNFFVVSSLLGTQTPRAKYVNFNIENDMPVRCIYRCLRVRCVGVRTESRGLWTCLWL